MEADDDMSLPPTIRYKKWWLETAVNPETGKRFTRAELVELARAVAMVFPEREAA